MDKSSKISIKINGEEKDYVEDVVDPLKKEEKPEEFQWIIPTPDGLGKKVIVLDDVKKKKKSKEKVQKTNIKKKRNNKLAFFLKDSYSKSIIISIVSASLIGVCFGFVFLGIFKQSKPDEISEKNKEVIATSVTPSQTQLNIPKITFNLAQVGMFKNIDSAKKNVDEISALGYNPVIYEKNDSFFVVIALSGKESTFLKDEVKKKLDSVYLKEETIAGEIYKGPKESVEMLNAEIETFNFLLSYLTNENFNNEKQLEQIKSTILILNNEKYKIKNKQLLNGLKYLQNIEKVISSDEKSDLTQTTEAVQYDMLSLFKILKEQKNTLTK